MSPSNYLYSAYFAAQDRFRNTHSLSGFEPDVIYDYIHSAHALAFYYEPHTKHENCLLCELFLRQVYFDLLEAIQDPNRSRTFRRVCLDSIHAPLLALKRYYAYYDNGDIQFLSLKHQLLRIQAPFD